MLLGFKRRFAPLVEDGSKTHTIRAKRARSKLGYAQRSPRVGEMCHCYVDPRQKTMRLLGRWVCTRVEEISVYERGDRSFGVVIDGVELDQSEKNALAWRDGFRNFGLQKSWAEMIDYWREIHRVSNVGPYTFDGQIIHWDYTREPPRPGLGIQTKGEPD